MEHWELEAQRAKEKKELLSKFPHLGKKARRKGRGNKWEYGTIILDKFNDDTENYEFIKYDDGTSEQLMCLPYEIWDEQKETWVNGWDETN